MRADSRRLWARRPVGRVGTRCGGTARRGRRASAAGRPASANSRWSELPLAGVARPSGPAARAPARREQRALDAGARLGRASAAGTVRPRPDLVERQHEAEVASRARVTRGDARARSRRGGRAGRCTTRSSASVAMSQTSHAGPDAASARRERDERPDARRRCRRRPGAGGTESVCAMSDRRRQSAGVSRMPTTLRERPVAGDAEAVVADAEAGRAEAILHARVRAAFGGGARGARPAAGGRDRAARDGGPGVAPGRRQRATRQREQRGDHALSVSLRGPARKPSSSSALLPRASRRPARRRRARARAA